MTINVVKNLSIKFDNYYNEYKNNKTSIDIYIIKDNMLEELNNFFNIMNNDKPFYLGIDFEFNRVNDVRQVALIQLNYMDEFIIMFDPSKINNKLKLKLKNIFFNTNCLKILHGAESLDIKYLFDDFFDNKMEKEKFTNNFYDTKFICEYLNIRDNIENKKCKIYLLILKFGLINENIYKNLIDNEEKMGPIYNIIVDVNDMSKELINYTLFDVFYLNTLIKILLSKMNSDEIKLINFFLHQTLLNKDKIDSDISLMNSYNNFYILDYLNNRYTVTYIIEYYTDILVTKKFNYNIINNIPFLKKILNMFLKKILITSLVKNITIYKKKNEPANNTVISELKRLNLYNKHIVISELNKFIHNDLIKIL